MNKLHCLKEKQHGFYYSNLLQINQPLQKRLQAFKKNKNH